MTGMDESGGSLRAPHFMRFWASRSLGYVGAEVTALALPLTAVTVLAASPEEMGLLVAAQNVPILLFGLLVGVWMDGRRRQPVLVGTDVARAAVISSIPIAATFGLLGMGQLYVVASIIGALSAFAAVAEQSFLPTLVGKGNLLKANAKLELSSSLAELGGPGIGGALAQAITAPFALALDGLCYAISAPLLRGMGDREVLTARPGSRRSVVAELSEGLRVLLRHPTLRPIILCASTDNFFAVGLFTPLYVLYLNRELGVSPVVLGLIMAAAGPGTLLGALLADRLARRYGLGPTLLGAQLITGLGRLLVPLAGGPSALLLGLLATAEFFNGFGTPLFNANQISLRQTLTPDHLQGRVHAGARFVMWGIIPAGAALGGFLGGWFGLRATLFLAGIGTLLATLWLLFLPVRKRIGK